MSDDKPYPVHVRDIVISGNTLSWALDGASQSVRRDEIILILESATERSSPDYFICCLREDPDDQQEPFNLLILQTEQIPREVRSLIVQELPPHLQQGANQEVDIIVSVKSGLGLAPKVWHRVLQPLWELVVQHGIAAECNSLYRLTTTDSAETIRTFARHLWASQTSSSNKRTIVLLSGDGGVVDLLNGSDHADSPKTLPLMALLPLGTGNALFHSTHKPLYSDPGPTPLVHAFRTLFTGTPRGLPVFRASFTPGSQIVTFSTAPLLPAMVSTPASSTRVTLLSTASTATGALGWSPKNSSANHTPMPPTFRSAVVAPPLLRMSPVRSTPTFSPH